MTNTQLLILAIVLVAIYLYWKYHSNKTLPLKPVDIIERTSKEVFFDASDFSADEE